MDVYFEKIEEENYDTFREDVKSIFSIAVKKEFGNIDNNLMITDDVVNDSLYKPNVEVYYVYMDGKKVGGVALAIDAFSHRNSVELLYVYPDSHSKGIGYRIWKSIEKKYPETKVWELVTPCFEKRNIHFYVNKCGFKIVEFYNQYHPDPNVSDSDEECTEEFFRFEKVMYE